MELTKRLSENLDVLLRTPTYPVAVKLIDGPDFPQKAMRPLKDLGNRISLCQGTAIARRLGRAVAFGPEDHSCPIVLMALGLKPMSSKFEEGLMAYPFYAETMEIAAMLNASHLVKINKPGNWHIILAPLAKAEFVPDVIQIYGNSAHIHRLTMAVNYKTGLPITMKLTERGSCVQVLLEAYNTGNYTCALPGAGDRGLAFCEEDVLKFAIPYNKFEEICDGLEGSEKRGGMKYPTIYPALFQGTPFPRQFDPVLEELGLK